MTLGCLCNRKASSKVLNTVTAAVTKITLSGMTQSTVHSLKFFLFPFQL